MGKGISTALLVWVLLVGSSSQFSEEIPAGAEERMTVPESREYIIESLIDEAYGKCFRMIQLNGLELETAIPFGQNGERFQDQTIFRGGKGDPDRIWEKIAELTGCADFTDYRHIIQSPGSKVIIFDLARGKWFAIRDEESFKKLSASPYPGTKKTVFVFNNHSRFTTVDLYNYLYCVGSVGLDCSGFVYGIQRFVAEKLGTDLDLLLSRKLNREPEDVPSLIGLPLYYNRPDLWEKVDDRIYNLRPGDIFLFMGREGVFRHSAVIQSIDWDKGKIIYVQCTDWAPQHQRGVHKSYIYFNPDLPFLRLSHEALEWTQKILPAFPGETGLSYWKNDGDRYRSYRDFGGSLVVRSRYMKILIEQVFPGYYNPEKILAGGGEDWLLP